MLGLERTELGTLKWRQDCGEETEMDVRVGENREQRGVGGGGEAVVVVDEVDGEGRGPSTVAGVRSSDPTNRAKHGANLVHLWQANVTSIARFSSHPRGGPAGRYDPLLERFQIRFHHVNRSPRNKVNIFAKDRRGVVIARFLSCQ